MFLRVPGTTTRASRKEEVMTTTAKRSPSIHTTRAAILAALLAALPATAAAQKPKAGAGAQVQKHLATFDDLDFNVYTGQKWSELHRSHSADIVVHWPDGHTTKGIQQHIEDLKVMFTFAPDNRIEVHPVKFGSGEWTAVTGWLEGTFTKPMALPGGKAIQPTGKAYKLPMATIGHWNEDGVMDEEYLFWDNAEFMKQIGLGQ
jgi:SnoaL-like polyketide cyclase